MKNTNNLYSNFKKIKLNISSHNDFIIASIFFFIGIFSRIPFVEKFHSHWDGPQFSLALIDYSFKNQTPSPPGYPLYILIGKFINLIILDLHQALITISVLEAGLGSVVIYFVGKNIFDRKAGIVSGVIFLTGSTFYYFSLTAYGYGLVPIFTSIFALSVYRIFIKNKKSEGILLGLTFGLVISLRPQEITSVFLLYFLGLIFLNFKNKIISLITLSFIFLTSNSYGFYSMGIKEYTNENINSFKQAFPPTSFILKTVLIIKGLLLTLGVSFIFLVIPLLNFKKNKNNLISNHKLIIFFSIWIIPGLLFNLLIRTDHAGHQMGYLTAFVILIGGIISKSIKNRFLFILVLIFIMQFNLYWFFYNRDPDYIKPYRITSFHYSDIRKNDLIIGNKVNHVENNFNPNNTLLVSTETYWRQYSYYLDNFELIALNALDNKDAPYIYNQYSTKNRSYKQIKSNKFLLEIPENITHIVLMDTPMNEWVKGNLIEIINLPGNSRLTVIKVNKNSKLFYDYRFIKIVN